nr:glycoside hydrolase family 2 TIM barrel-domain containing protein [Cellulosilyticum ruminicola]
MNDRPIFLRGKHDGLIFPLTGFAPTDLESWLHTLETAKSYGINHYRFHTCCPPEATFEAADRLGIYMQPELPFWGTITVPGEENHNQAEQDYLIEEGFRILRHFGNHPSFVMMSLGNELWDSQFILNKILGDYKAFDSHHLYVQGSNNFQFSPYILENDDFFSGVRFSHDRLFRSSYAMCDAPQGIIQTMAPGTHYNFDESIHPTEIMAYQTKLAHSSNDSSPTKQTIEIQYGTDVKTVSLSEINDALIPQIPVVSHEVGQYETFPNFDEIQKYTGSIKAKNLEVFRDRLEEKGLLGDFGGYIYEAGDQFTSKVLLANYSEHFTAPTSVCVHVSTHASCIHWQLASSAKILNEGIFSVSPNAYGLVNIGEVHITLPEVTSPTPLTFTLTLSTASKKEPITNSYKLMITNLGIYCC